MVAKRQITIAPYSPDDTENLGNNTGQYVSNDMGKAVKYSGDTMVLCASGDPIIGFISSVSPGTNDGYSIGGVNKHNRQAAIDSAGSLSVGDIVVAGAPGTLGTLANQNVIVEPSAGDAKQWPWVVISVSSGGAGRACIVERA